jgi:hypothetical protein
MVYEILTETELLLNRSSIIRRSMRVTLEIYKSAQQHFTDFRSFYQPITMILQTR